MNAYIYVTESQKKIVLSEKGKLEKKFFYKGQKQTKPNNILFRNIFKLIKLQRLKELLSKFRITSPLQGREKVSTGR